jgi:hypothetical protein
LGRGLGSCIFNAESVYKKEYKPKILKVVEREAHWFPLKNGKKTSTLNGLFTFLEI